MPRITHVAKAQQRYETKPVIDPATGEQKRTPVMRNGVQRTTKRGKPIFMEITEPDKTKPLPPYKCDSCHQEILPGTPYKHISPRSGPYGGRTLRRHEACPTWNVWEYSSSLSARVAEISHNAWTDFSDTTFESTDDVQEWLNTVAEAIREIAQEKEEAADNIEEGFQHETMQSQELRDVSEQLNSWADDVENVSIPDYPEAEEVDCEDCEGVGNFSIDEKLEEARRRRAVLIAKPLTDLETHAQVVKELHALDKLIRVLEERIADGDYTLECDTCDGAGKVEPEEPDQDQIDQWRDEVQGEASVIDECPV
jgi:hypothetical protein